MIWTRVERIGILSLALMVLTLSVPGVALAGWEQDATALNKALSRDLLDKGLEHLETLKQKHAGTPELHETYGEIYWRQGKTKLAVESFNKAIQLNDKSAFAYAGLALVDISRDRWDSAEKYARMALDRKDSNWVANYAMGRVFLHKGDIENAFKHFEKGKNLKKREDRRDLFESGMGLLALKDNDPEAAETNLIKARALAGQTVEHVMNLTDMYEMTEQWGPASTLLQGMASTSDSPQIHYRLGRAYENQRRFNEAHDEYKKAHELDSEYGPALEALGNIYLLDTRRTHQAIEFLQKALAVEPTPKVKRSLGIAMVRVRRGEEALPLLEESYQEEPDLYTKVAIARAYLQTDNWEKGVEMFESDVDVRTEAQAEDLIEVAARLRRARDFEKARGYLSLALQKDPDNVDAYYEEGVIEIHQKNFDMAIEKIGKKIKAHPNDAAAARNLGIAYMGKNDYQNAQVWLEKATKLAPKSRSTWIQLAGAQAQLRQNQKAIISYSQALRLDPKNVSALRGRGFLYLGAEQYPNAIKDLRAARDLDPNHVDTLVGLGQALLNSSQYDDSRVAFEQAIALEPTNTLAIEGLNVLRSVR